MGNIYPAITFEDAVLHNKHQNKLHHAVWVNDIISIKSNNIIDKSEVITYFNFNSNKASQLDVALVEL